MNQEWTSKFRKRIDEFQTPISKRADEQIISIKMKVDSGCYERSCCPKAWELVDEYISSHRDTDANYELVKHESGPEILTAIAAGVALSASIIDLITAILNARTEGMKRGDKHKSAIKLIVRGLDRKGGYVEKIVLNIEPEEKVKAREIGKMLSKTIEGLFKK
jgi:hypothetical protein